MNTDSAFMIGTTHSVCQDYAIAKDRYVIVSDGCSTSPDTDIGVRLVVQAANQLLSNAANDDVVSLHKEAVQLALKWAHEIGVRSQSIDATLLTAHCNDDELMIGASGDGVIVLESTAGTIDVYSVSFPSGFPLYPAYVHQPDRLRAWQSSLPACRETRHFQGLFNSLDLVETSTCTNVTETIRVKTNNLRQVALISDGVHSFYKHEGSTTSKHITSIPLDQVLKDLVAFKSGHGAFVGRRVKKFEKECVSNGWYHADDLAIGAIYFGN